MTRDRYIGFRKIFHCYCNSEGSVGCVRCWKPYCTCALQYYNENLNYIHGSVCYYFHLIRNKKKYLKWGIAVCYEV